MFFPRVAPWPRGIQIVIRAEILKAKKSYELAEMFSEFYYREKFVRVELNNSDIHEVIGTNFCKIFPTCKEKGAKIKITIDNLLKGGAGQAIQNLNIISGLPGNTGL